MRATIIYTGQGACAFDFNIPCCSLEDKSKFRHMVERSLVYGITPIEMGIRAMTAGDMILFPDGVYSLLLPFDLWEDLDRSRALQQQFEINAKDTISYN